MTSQSQDQVLDQVELQVRKRLPPSLPRRNNDVYVTTKTAFPAQLSRCLKLLKSSTGESTLYLHALGAAVPLAASLAHRIQKHHPEIVVEVHTRTVELTDDFQPLRSGGGNDEFTRVRSNSAIHLKLTKKLEDFYVDKKEESNVYYSK